MEDLHFHFDDFKTSLETDFNHLKEAASRNIQNIQTSLNLQQMYSSSLCSHVNNICSKLSELQKQIQHHRMYMNQGDTIQIEAPEFDPDIDGNRPPSTVKKPDEVSIPGTLQTIPEVIEPEDDSRSTPGTNTAQPTCQETYWPDAIPVQIPRVSSSTAQPKEQGYNTCQAQHYTENFEIPKLEENSEEEQFADFDSFMVHHNTHRASKQIQQKYRSHLQDLDDDQHYAVIDRVDSIRVHQLHKTIGQQISRKPCEDLRKSLKEYLAEAEVKPGEKSYMVIDHLAQELVPCKAASSARSIRISIYIKGTLLTVNVLIL